MVDDEIVTEYHSTIKCNEFYASQMETDFEMNVEFSSDLWICPDIETITIENNPSLFYSSKGTAFYVAINTCPDAKAIDEKYGLTSYADASLDCATALEIEKYSPAVEFHSKTMSQSPATPKQYDETGKTESYFQNRIETNLVSTFCQVYRSSVTRQRISFFKQEWWSILPFFDAIKAFKESKPKNEDFNVITYLFNVEQGAIDPITILATNESNSRVKINISQNIESQDIYWKHSSIFGALSTIGGTAVTIIAFTSYLLSNYQ